ncbi:hypothetical protein SAMN05444678_10929 [Sphingomonas sp. YR710]|nr:hypothetical protein SAMN05444678_10929 [Sphingomonas sp. YR710]
MRCAWLPLLGEVISYGEILRDLYGEMMRNDLRMQVAEVSSFAFQKQAIIFLLRGRDMDSLENERRD